ncbi:hypothetical protein D3C80_1547190 [compost metagenome]
MDFSERAVFFHLADDVVDLIAHRPTFGVHQRVAFTRGNTRHDGILRFVLDVVEHRRDVAEVAIDSSGSQVEHGRR